MSKSSVPLGCRSGRLVFTGDADVAVLRNVPEVREKVQRVIKQGHIDPEDFNGVSVLFWQSAIREECID